MNLLSLADEYGASTNAVRETLIQLTGSGLIVRQTMQGFRVAPATQSDFLELVKTLGWLEETGIRESIANGDAVWEERVLIAHRALSQLAGRPAEQIDGALLDEQLVSLHDALISACHSSILIEQCRVLHQRLVRYRNLAGLAEPRNDAAQAGSLLTVRDAALARDTGLSNDLLRTHFRLVTEAVLASKALI